MNKQHIFIPYDVNIHNYINNTIIIVGLNGSLSTRIINSINIKIKKRYITIETILFFKENFTILKLINSLIISMIIGVRRKFIKKLKVCGLGYNIVNKNNDILKLTLGYSHEILYCIPPTIKALCCNNVVEIAGCNKYLVSQICLNIKNIKNPNVFKDKGIKYKNEILFKKESKKK